MEKSIFTDKSKRPDQNDLMKALGDTYPLWMDICTKVSLYYPQVQNEWKFPGEKYGWSFRIKDNKRVLVYLLPRDRFFKLAMVFGQKATEAILESNINEGIKEELRTAKVYAEGRGIRIDIRDKSNLKDIAVLISIKIVS